MAHPPDGIPISSLSFEQLQSLRPRLARWVYPQRDISLFIPMFSGLQRAALNLYGWVAILMVPMGLALPIVLGSWWWLLLLPGAGIVWKANRRSMEDFFIANLQDDSAFYEEIRRSPIADTIKIVVEER